MEAGDVVAQRYRLERPLGEGGMGAVWAATHLVTYKAVALKFVRDKTADPAVRKRALREARAACAVLHPNVVEVHDVVEDADGTPILVMDLLEGESLADRLARERVLSPAEALRIVRPVVSALAAAHAAGVVHRDLKPENVFLVADGGVKILDFGVAKLAGREPATKETNRLTETGAMIGTPHYMSPEQAFGEADVDARADLFAVGAVLYECLTGGSPTDGKNLGQILKALATGAIAPIAQGAPHVAPELAALVDELLAIDRDARPASSAVVLARLDALGAQPDAVARAAHAAVARPARESLTPRPATHDADPQRRRSRAAFVAALVASIVVGGATTAWLAAGWRRPADAAVRPTAPPIASDVASAPVASASAPVASTIASEAPKPPARPRAKPAPSAVARPAASTSAGRGSPLLDQPTF